VQAPMVTCTFRVTLTASILSRSGAAYAHASLVEQLIGGAVRAGAPAPSQPQDTAGTRGRTANETTSVLGWGNLPRGKDLPGPR
jgi:hypothetical protein